MTEVHDRAARHALVVHQGSELYGADRMLVESVRALLDAGWAVTVALPSEGPLTTVLRDTGAPIVVTDMPVLRKAFLSPRGLLSLAGVAARRLPDHVRLIRSSRADVVYVNTVTIPGWVLLARVMGRPVVCHVHEAEGGMATWMRRVLSSPLLLADLVVANSSATRDLLVADIRALSEKVTIVHNGLDGPAPGQVAPLRTALSAPVRLVIVGRVTARKGTDVAVRVLSDLVRSGLDAVLDIVGGVYPGTEAFQQELLEEIALLGLTDRVRWSGEVPDAYDRLSEADIALAPSRVESFGNTALEAVLAGRPVVAAATQGLLEVVRDGRDGTIVPVGDPAATADAVRDLVAAWPATVRRAAEAAAETAERFSRARYSAGIVAAMGDAAGGRRRARRAGLAVTDATSSAARR